jgi:hypothetical protein
MGIKTFKIDGVDVGLEKPESGIVTATITPGAENQKATARAIADYLRHQLQEQTSLPRVFTHLKETALKDGAILVTLEPGTDMHMRDEAFSYNNAHKLLKQMQDGPEVLQQLEWRAGKLPEPDHRHISLMLGGVVLAMEVTEDQTRTHITPVLGTQENGARALALVHNALLAESYGKAEAAEHMHMGQLKEGRPESLVVHFSGGGFPALAFANIVDSVRGLQKQNIRTPAELKRASEMSVNFLPPGGRTWKVAQEPDGRWQLFEQGRQHDVHESPVTSWTTRERHKNRQRPGTGIPDAPTLVHR